MPVEFVEIIRLYQIDLARSAATLEVEGAKALAEGNLRKGYDLLKRVEGINYAIRNMTGFPNVIARAYENLNIRRIPGLDEDITSLVFHGEILEPQGRSEASGEISGLEVGPVDGLTMLSPEAAAEQAMLEENPEAKRSR